MKAGLFEAPRLSTSPVVRGLILVNVAFWLLGWVGDVTRTPSLSSAALLDLLAVFPERVISEGTLWTPFTYMFLHGSLTHLFVNMLGLALLGPDLERTFRSLNFLVLYLLSGFVGGVAYVLVSHVVFGQFHPCVGASGAIMGLLGAIVAIYPQRVYVLLPLMIPMRAVVLAVLLVTSHIFFIITPFGGAVAYDVHLFGGLAGYGFTLAVAEAHRRRWRIRLPEWDPPRQIPELEMLLARFVRDPAGLSREEMDHMRLLEQALRYEDVLTREEMSEDAPGLAAQEG